LQQARLDHPRTAAIDSFVQRVATGIEGEVERPKRAVRKRVAGTETGCSLTTAAFDLEGSDHSPQIVRVDAIRRLRIDVLERPVQSRGVAGRHSGDMLFFKVVAKFEVGFSRFE
jgi:hypothetical protein